MGSGKGGVTLTLLGSQDVGDWRVNLLFGIQGSTHRTQVPQVRGFALVCTRVLWEWMHGNAEPIPIVLVIALAKAIMRDDRAAVDVKFIGRRIANIAVVVETSRCSDRQTDLLLATGRPSSGINGEC